MPDPNSNNSNDPNSNNSPMTPIPQDHHLTAESEISTIVQNSGPTLVSGTLLPGA